jgi:hypothetical protein
LVERIGFDLPLGGDVASAFMGHALLENRNGLIVGAVATHAPDHAERLDARHLMEPHADRPWKVTLGGDKGFATQDFVAELNEIKMMAHEAQHTNGRRSAIDGRTTRPAGYAIGLRIRKRIERAFGLAKTVAGLRKARHRGLPEVDWQFTLAMVAYTLVRLPKLLAVAAWLRESAPSAPKRPKNTGHGGATRMLRSDFSI